MLVISIFLIFLTAQAQDFRNPFPHDDNSSPDPNEDRRCPKWQAWENVTCWWPNRSYDSLPQSCTNLTLPPKVPAVIRELFENEIRDKYNMIVNEYNVRGKPAICGHCSLSFRCRVRKNRHLADDDGDFEEEDFGKRGHRKHHSCPPKQVQPIKSNCSDTKPCQIKKVFGGCPTPFFLKRGGHRRAHSHMENGDYEKAMDELVNSFQMPIDMPQDGSEMNMEGQENGFRQKRQSDFGSSNDQDYPTSDFQVPTPNFDAPAPPVPPMGYRHQNWLNRRWRPWLGNRYSSTRPGMYPSDRVGDYGSMDMGQPGNPNFGGGQGMGNMMFGRRHGGPRGGINEDQHRKRRPSPKQIIIYWLLHGTKCISSGNTCLCCCGHFVPNAQNKTCDDITKLHPHFSNMVETSFPQDDNADFGSQLPMMTSFDDNKRPRFPDYSNINLNKNPDAFY